MPPPQNPAVIKAQADAAHTQAMVATENAKAAGQQASAQAEVIKAAADAKSSAAEHFPALMPRQYRRSERCSQMKQHGASFDAFQTLMDTLGQAP